MLIFMHICSLLELPVPAGRDGAFLGPLRAHGIARRCTRVCPQMQNRLVAVQEQQAALQKQATELRAVVDAEKASRHGGGGHAGAGRLPMSRSAFSTVNAASLGIYNVSVYVSSLVRHVDTNTYLVRNGTSAAGKRT